MRKKLELLAPAKNEIVGKAAINHGADAVYIGAPDFGARKQAANSIIAIEQLIKHAHIYNSKVFIALNTIIYEHELAEVQKLIHQLYNIGADALIIQDMGILEMDLPPIPIHASTQANNFELKQISFFEKIGLTRAVLARELTLPEIKNIRKNTTIELEAFIHGALCVSLSGQCYLSQSIGQRSANRGECAQACRLKYTLSNAENKIIIKDKHLLSLKDLSVGESILQMAHVGITSFKIEGRLKDEAYVKNVVAYYRQLLDKVIEMEPQFLKDSSGTIYPQFTPDIYKSFNRQFTRYFISGRSNKMTSFDSPKSFGELLGTVTSCNNWLLKIDTDKEISNGDGLCYLDENEELKGIRVEKIENGNLLVSDNVSIKKGTQIFRNHDHAFLKQLDKSNDIRKISCTVHVFEKDGVISIHAIDEDEISVEIELPEANEKARNQELIVKMFKTQFLNISDAYFKIIQFNWNVQSEIGFYRIAEVNQLRRSILALLLAKRIENYKPHRIQFVPTTIPFYENNPDYRYNVSNSLAVKFYARHGANIIEMSPEITEDYFNINLMTTRYCLKFELGICERKQLNIPIKEDNSLHIENKFGKYRLEFDCDKCKMFVKKI